MEKSKQIIYINRALSKLQKLNKEKFNETQDWLKGLPGIKLTKGGKISPTKSSVSDETLSEISTKFPKKKKETKPLTKEQQVKELESKVRKQLRSLESISNMSRKEFTKNLSVEGVIVTSSGNLKIDPNSFDDTMEESIFSQLYSSEDLIADAKESLLSEGHIEEEDLTSADITREIQNMIFWENEDDVYEMYYSLFEEGGSGSLLSSVTSGISEKTLKSQAFRKKHEQLVKTMSELMQIVSNVGFTGTYTTKTGKRLGSFTAKRKQLARLLQSFKAMK